MPKAKLKTVATQGSVTAFLAKVDQRRRKDCDTIIEMMREATGAEPQMWGASIVGFGRFAYKYATGREGEWMVTGFSPRKSDLTLYIMPNVDAFPQLLSQLGKYKTGKSCLYIKTLEDVDSKVLRQLIMESADRLADQRVDRPRSKR